MQRSHTVNPPPPIPEPHARRWQSIAAAWRESPHLLVIAPAGVPLLTMARHLAAAIPSPIGSAPFRAPHHTVSTAGLLGSASQAHPGEATLAHGGLLYLDDPASFARCALEGLGEPMTTGEIAYCTPKRGEFVFSARFRLFAAAAPCPCGYLGHASRSCTCSAATVRRYRQRLAPLANHPRCRVLNLAPVSDNGGAGGLCDPECPGWAPFDTDDNPAIQRCDECAEGHGTAAVYDDGAAERDAAGYAVLRMIGEVHAGPDLGETIAALMATTTGRAALRDAIGGPRSRG